MKTTDRLRSWCEMIRSSHWINKYTITLAIFCTWMLFFDKHNMVVQYRLRQLQKGLQQQIAYDRQRLKEVRLEQAEIENDLETYAREKYLMHRDDEEVFLVVEKQ